MEINLCPLKLEWSGGRNASTNDFSLRNFKRVKKKVLPEKFSCKFFHHKHASNQGESIHPCLNIHPMALLGHVTQAGDSTQEHFFKTRN